MRFPPHKLSYTEQDRLWSNFCGVLVMLKSKNDIQRFLKDLLNRQERMMFIRRLQIAKMLQKGITYDEIKKKLRTSTTTIAKVQRWLEFGREGYKRAIDKLLQIENRK